MEGDNNNNNKDNNPQNKIPEDFDPEENKDQVNEINDPNFNEEDIYVNPDEIQEIEEIDKEALQAELGAEMDIEENNNNDNNNNDNIENKNENNNNEIKDEEEEIFHKEYENFSTKGEIYAINFHQESGTLIIGDGEDTTYFYDLSKKEIKREEKLNKDSVNFIKFSFDNKYMLTASVDGSINIFLVSKNFSLVNTIKDQDAEINWIDWHPKAPCFAFGTADGSVWDPGSGDHGRHDLNDESRFLTKELEVTYAIPEDNKRKANSMDKYKKMAQRHPKLFRLKIFIR